MRQGADPAVARVAPCSVAGRARRARDRAARRCGARGSARRGASSASARRACAGSFSARRCPTTTQSRRSRGLRRRREHARRLVDHARTCAASAAGGARGASSCSTMSRSARSSESRASALAGQVAVQVGAGERDDQRRRRERSRESAAIEAWLRRACSAISRSAGSPLPRRSVQSPSRFRREQAAPSAARCASCRCWPRACRA